MLLLNVVGIIAYRTKVVDKNGGRQFSNFVLDAGAGGERLCRCGV